MKTSILTLALIFSCSAQANSLSFKATGKNLEGVPLHSSLSEGISSSKLELPQKGAGIRTKKVLMVGVKVYVAEYFSNSKAQAMRLQFFRDVDAEKVMTSFKEALEANKVDLKDKDIQAFLSSVENGGEATKGSQMTILSLPSEAGTNGETLTYLSPTGKVTTLNVSSGTGVKVMNIWLGTPADDGLAELKKAFTR